jgi:peptidoglycan/LPS O-acetylase OafA/YrhL
MAYQFAFASQDAYLPWVLLPEFFPVFAVGIGYAVASAHASTAPEDPGWAQRIARRASWAWLVAPMLMLLSADRYGDYGIVTGGVRSRSIEFVGMLVALCLVMPVVFVAARPGPIRRFLAWRPMVEIGVLSYGIYLWHFPLIEWFWDNLTTPPREPLTPTWYLANPWWTLAFAFASAVTIAAISWYGLERPLMNRARGRLAASN